MMELSTHSLPINRYSKKVLKPPNGGQGGARAQQDQRPKAVRIDYWFNANLI